MQNTAFNKLEFLALLRDGRFKLHFEPHELCECDTPETINLYELRKDLDKKFKNPLLFQ